MRGNQEAYILVKIKDGRHFVCAINKLKGEKSADREQKSGVRINLERDVLWH